MAEVAGIVVGSLSLTMQIYDKLEQYSNGVKEAREKAEEIAIEIDCLADILESVESTISTMHHSDPVWVARTGIRSCADAISTIRSKLVPDDQEELVLENQNMLVTGDQASNTATKSSMKRKRRTQWISFPLTEAKIKNLKDVMNALRAHLQDALLVFQHDQQHGILTALQSQTTELSTAASVQDVTSLRPASAACTNKALSVAAQSQRIEPGLPTMIIARHDNTFTRADDFTRHLKLHESTDVKAVFEGELPAKLINPEISPTPKKDDPSPTFTSTGLDQGGGLLTTGNIQTFHAESSGGSNTRSMEQESRQRYGLDTSDLGIESYVEESSSYTASSKATGNKHSVFDRTEAIPHSSITTTSDHGITRLPSRMQEVKLRSANADIDEDMQEQGVFTTEGTYLDSADLRTVDDDGLSIASNDESIGSKAGRSERTPAEHFATKKLGSFLGNLGEIRSLHETALQELGEKRFVRNYRRLLKTHFLRLRAQAKAPTRIEGVTLRILKSRPNRIDIARNIVRVLKPSDTEEDLSPYGTLNLEPEERLSIADWMARLRSSDPDDPENLEQEPVTDSDDESDDSGSDNREEEEAAFETEVTTKLNEIYDVSRRDLTGIELDIRLLIFPASLRDMLETVPKKDIRVFSKHETSFTNRTKALIEDNTPFEWCWWPFRPRSHRLPSGHQRVEFKVSSITQSILQYD